MDHFRGRLHAIRSHSRPDMEEDGAPSAGAQAPAREDIARLAYSYWEERGRHDGSAVEDWLRAERAIRERM